MDWCLYDRDLRHERVNAILSLALEQKMKFSIKDFFNKSLVSCGFGYIY